MLSRVLAFSTAGRYVFTFDTVWGEVKGAKVLTMPIKLSIFSGFLIIPWVKVLPVPESLETTPLNCLLSRMYLAAKKYNNI